MKNIRTAFLLPIAFLGAAGCKSLEYESEAKIHPGSLRAEASPFHQISLAPGGASLRVAPNSIVHVSLSRQKTPATANARTAMEFKSGAIEELLSNEYCHTNAPEGYDDIEEITRDGYQSQCDYSSVFRVHSGAPQWMIKFVLKGNESGERLRSSDINYSLTVIPTQTSDTPSGKMFEISDHTSSDLIPVQGGDAVMWETSWNSSNLGMPQFARLQNNIKTSNLGHGLQCDSTGACNYRIAELVQPQQPVTDVLTIRGLVNGNSVEELEIRQPLAVTK